MPNENAVYKQNTLTSSYKLDHHTLSKYYVRKKKKNFVFLPYLG